MFDIALELTYDLRVISLVLFLIIIIVIDERRLNSIQKSKSRSTTTLDQI